MKFCRNFLKEFYPNPMKNVENGATLFMPFSKICLSVKYALGEVCPLVKHALQ
jgi:hypothetical protein